MAADELRKKLWAAADIMRGTMSADEYKDYLLGLVFYKYLSDRQLYAVVDLLEDRKPGSLDEAQKIYEEARKGEDWDDLRQELEESYSFAIEPAYTFTALYHEINDKTFTTDHLRQAMRDIEQGGSAKDGEKLYEDLFEDFDIDSKSLGTTPQKRNQMLSEVMKTLAGIDFTEYGADALGDAYEYLIGEFASASGKKAGEFQAESSSKNLQRKLDKRFQPCYTSSSHVGNDERKLQLFLRKSGCLPTLSIMYGQIQHGRRCYMSKQQVENDVMAIAEELLKDQSEIELVDVEYVKERDWYLRVFIDKAGGIEIDDCQALSERLEKVLDEKDIIRDSYILEVSSPGLDRQLKKPRDFVREQGKKVDVTLYAPVDGTKEFTGVLEGYDEDAKTVTIDGKAWPLEKISVIRLHIDF